MRRTLYAIVAVLCLVLVGCATPPASYVVLLNNDDGTVGKVQVTGNKGATTLEKARDGAFFSAKPGTTFVATDEQIKKDFGPALAARPTKPITFLLQFQAGGAKLTPESELELAKVVEEIGKRDVPDVSIIGHTDTEGDAEQNEKLGLERAKLVSTLLISPKLDPAKVTVESHGEKNLLVPTPDNTPEPRNRRVEITVR
jgi:peptidoglycan-associated lipoprotein